LVTGRCRWSAVLVNLIGDMESALQREFETNPAGLPSEAEVIRRAIRQLQDLVSARIVDDINIRLSRPIGDSHREFDRDLIRRLFIICNLFDNQANGIKVFFTDKEVDTLLALGLGQFLSPESLLRGVHDTPVRFDEMTVVALNDF